MLQSSIVCKWFGGEKIKNVMVIVDWWKKVWCKDVFIDELIIFSGFYWMVIFYGG